MQNNNENEIIDILGALEASNNKLEESIQNKINNSIKKDIIENTIPLEGKKLESEEEKVFEEIISDKNIIDSLAENNIDPLAENYIEKQTKKINTFLSAAIFGLKYIVTSIFIFSVLLLTTNYAAYTNIVKSYIYKDELKKESISLLNGAEAGEIIEGKQSNKYEIDKNSKSNLSNNKLKIPKKTIKVKTKKDKMELLMEKEAKTSKEGKRFSITKLVSNLKNEEISLGINIIPYENRIIIPKIGKNVPLIDIKEKTVKGKSKLDNIFMKELEYGIVRYPGSAKPGEKGNSFIFGHSSNFPWIKGDYNDVFARLGQLNKGDIVYSYYGQKKYKYKITTKKVIKPSDVSILKRDKNKKELTLMTCWPVGTTLNRLILIGELIEE